MASCWAPCLGNCSNKQSREHLVTQSLFLGDSIKVQGFPWCKTKPVEIGLASATAKILCQKHNNDLSVIDSAGKEASEVFRELVRQLEARVKLKPRPWTVKKFKLDGYKLERWFLKTLINLCCDREYPIGRDSNVKGRPSDRLVRIAYGLEKFKGNAGLYLVTGAQTRSTIDEKLFFIPLLRDNVEAGVFVFYTIMLMVYLEKEGVNQESLNGFVFNGVDLGKALITLHGPDYTFKHKKYVSHKLLFRW
jgi:hypothetical protein